MLDKFWETLGEELAKRWLDYLFGPAFLFWWGGFALYIWENGWDAIISAWAAWPIYTQVMAIIGAMLLVFLSSLSTSPLQLTIIRILEGYWPWPLKYLGSWMIRRNQNKLKSQKEELYNLKKKEKAGSISDEEKESLSDLELWVHCNPASKKDLLPTRLGNLLRASEMASRRKYGLDSIVCWPRLWCLLPECLRDDLISSRSALNQQAELAFWGLLFIVWTIFSPLAAAISIAWMIIAYRLMLQTAAAYGDLIETAFDLHRFALYDALAWEKPKNSDEEAGKGLQLTEFLWTGTKEKKIDYIHPSK